MLLLDSNVFLVSQKDLEQKYTLLKTMLLLDSNVFLVSQKDLEQKYTLLKNFLEYLQFKMCVELYLKNILMIFPYFSTNLVYQNK